MKASKTVKKPAIVAAIAEQGDMTKVQAEAALAAFTDVVMSNVSGKDNGYKIVVRCERRTPLPWRFSVKRGYEGAEKPGNFCGSIRGERPGVPGVYMLMYCFRCLVLRCTHGGVADDNFLIRSHYVVQPSGDYDRLVRSKRCGPRMARCSLQLGKLQRLRWTE